MEFQDELSKYKALYDKSSPIVRNYGMVHEGQNWTLCERHIKSLPRQETLLDVSCGRGETRGISGGKMRWHGTETVEELCRPDDVTHAVLPDLPWEFAHWDNVMCCDVIEHIPPEEVGAAMAELVRVAKKTCWMTIDTRQSSFVDPDDPNRRIPLHISRFPRKFWLMYADDIARERGCGCTYSSIRGNKHILLFDMTKSYDPDWYKAKWDDTQQNCPEHSWNYFFYDKYFPLEKIPGIEREASPQSWRLTFEQDVAEHGIRQPILLYNWHHPHFTQPQEPYYIRDGNNRARALWKAGQRYAPCVVFGIHNVERVEGNQWKRPPMTIEQVNHELIKEGQLVWERKWDKLDLPCLTGASHPSEVMSIR